MNLYNYELYLLRRSVGASMLPPEPVEQEQDESGPKISKQTLEAIAKRDAIVQYIAEEGPKTPKEVWIRFELVDCTAHNYLNQLVSEGRLVKRVSGKKIAFFVAGREEKRAA